MQVQSLGWEDPLEEGMATHSRILAWRIPWTEEPGGRQSMGSQRVAISVPRGDPGGSPNPARDSPQKLTAEGSGRQALEHPAVPAQTPEACSASSQRREACGVDAGFPAGWEWGGMRWDALVWEADWEMRQGVVSESSVSLVGLSRD